MDRFAIPQIVKKPVEVQATDVLRDAIVTGTIPAGSRVTEIQVSEQLNLSRATVRQAFRQLANEGLLHLVPYTGWTVLALNAHDVWELYTLRSAVERLAAQLLAKSLDDEKAARLTAAYDALVKECSRGHAARIAEADFALHKEIIRLAGHSRLETQYALIEQQIRMYIRSSDALIPERGSIIEQHKPIVDSILSHNADKAGRLSEQHNLTEGEKLSSHLKVVEESDRRAAKRPRGERRKSQPRA
jgi:DNA-binding GntR family transcriptional regulator